MAAHSQTTLPPPGLADLPGKALLGLLRLSSAALPVGAYAYSQGLEWAIAQRWISNNQELAEWLTGLLQGPLACWDVPLLARLVHALQDADCEALHHWNAWLLAGRGTAELRTADLQLGEALLQLLPQDSLPATMPQPISWTTAFAIAAQSYQIQLPQTVLGYLWAWTEQQVLAATKLMPLGQRAAQRLLVQLQEAILAAADCGLALPNERLGAASPGWMLACMLHETQYSRLFRS